MLSDVATGRFEVEWRNYPLSNIKTLQSHDLSVQLSESQHLELVSRFEHLSSLSLTFGLCHGDLSPRNVVLDGNQMSLVDWGCAHAHVVPHYDFGELLHEFDQDSDELRAFVSGYGLAPDEKGLFREIESLCCFVRTTQQDGRKTAHLNISTTSWKHSTYL